MNQGFGFPINLRLTLASRLSQGSMVSSRVETLNGSTAATMTNTISMGISLKGHTRSHVETT
jgi:hypothetical protein